MPSYSSSMRHWHPAEKRLQHKTSKPNKMALPVINSVHFLKGKFVSLWEIATTLQLRKRQACSITLQYAIGIFPLKQHGRHQHRVLDSIQDSQMAPLTDLVCNEGQVYHTTLLYLHIQDWIPPQENSWDSMTLQKSGKHKLQSAFFVSQNNSLNIPLAIRSMHFGECFLQLQKYL